MTKIEARKAAARLIAALAHADMEGADFKDHVLNTTPRNVMLVEGEFHYIIHCLNAGTWLPFKEPKARRTRRKLKKTSLCVVPNKEESGE